MAERLRLATSEYSRPTPLRVYVMKHLIFPPLMTATHRFLSANKFVTLPEDTFDDLINLTHLWVNLMNNDLCRLLKGYVLQ